MAGIIVKETVVEKDPTIISEVVVLPGIKGEKGDPFTYDDFTPEQIAELQRPATEAAAVANQAAENANNAATDIKVLGVTLTAEEAKRESAESSRASAESERAEAEAQRESSFSQMQTTLEGLISDTNTATSNANTAAGNAENAATAANNSASLANDAAAAANEAAQNVDGRVTSLEEKASQVYENLAAIEASGETNPNKIYIDGETMIPYVYKGGEFMPFNIEIDDSNYVKRIDGQVPIQGIRYIDTSIWPDCSKQFHNVFYDEDTKTIYCQVGGYSRNGGIVKIQNDKIVAKLGMDTSYNLTCESSVVKIGEYIYAIQFGWNWTEQIIKIKEDDFSALLRVTHENVLGPTLYSYKNGIFALEENLYLWGQDGKLYLVNQDDLSLSEPIFENLQYVLWFDKQRLVIADDTSIFEYTGGTDKINQKAIPEGFETISQLASTGIDYSSLGCHIYIRSSDKVRTLYTNSSHASGESTNSLIMYSEYSRIYNMRKIYNIIGGHDYNAYRDIRTGALYYNFALNANLSNSPYITVDALGLNVGPYLIGDTPIYPTYRGFLM